MGGEGSGRKKQPKLPTGKYIALDGSVINGGKVGKRQRDASSSAKAIDHLEGAVAEDVDRPPAQEASDKDAQEKQDAKGSLNSVTVRCDVSSSDEWLMLLIGGCYSNH
jgi:hypothetical protein